MARRATYIWLYKTGRTDPTYQNIWAFADATERATFLNTKFPVLYQNCKYWRVGEPVKLNIPYENSLGYDYAVITNNFGTAESKTYYAFITARAYISSNVTMFNLDLDIVQSWYFSQALDGGQYPFWQVSGMVTKSTSLALPPRGTPTDFPAVERVCSSFTYADIGYGVVIYSSIDIRDLSSINYVSAIIDGQYTASPPYVMLANVSAISNIINDANTKGVTDAIAGIYLFPLNYVNVTLLSTSPLLATDSSLYLTVATTVPQPTSCDGYTPTNSCLLGYGYSYFTINNGQGEVAQYNFEDFDGTPIFNSRLSLASGSPVVILYPTNYISNNTNEYRQRAIKITSAPACSYLNDTYKIWLAQTQNSRAAAINQTTEAINQAEYARSQSFAYNFGSEIKDLEETARPVVSTALYKLQDIQQNGILSLFTSGGKNKSTGTFGGGSSRGGGAGIDLNTGAKNIQNVTGFSGHLANDLMGIYDLGIAYFNKQLGIETAYQYDFAVKNAQLAQNALLAGYKDKASIPATATGSNAYGDVCVLQQYGFMIATYTPTSAYAQWIDKTLSSGGATTNQYMTITRKHNVFDYFQTLSPRIDVNVDVRPGFARDHLIACLTNGIYLWYYTNGDISPYIGTPYGLTNEVI